MAIDPKIITVELQAISGALKLAGSALKKVQTQIPPGPPNEPAHLTLLQDISTAGAEISQLASDISKNGGTGQ